MSDKNRDVIENSKPERRSPDDGNVKQSLLSDKKNVRRRWIISSLFVFVAVIFFLGSIEDTVDVEERKEAALPQLVSVEHISTGPQTAIINSFTEVRPRWSTELRAAVSGQIVRVTDHAFAGEFVEAGTILMELENSQYAAELAAAELMLKETKLALLHAENATKVVSRDFERNGITPPNDLALKLPQLEIARSSVLSAEARVAAAKKQLKDTTITAPFSGFITERFVSLGAAVNPGDPLVRLSDNRTFELIAQLSRKDWNLLKKPLSGSIAQIYDQNNNMIAEAKVRMGGGFLNEATRQYQVFLEISNNTSLDVLSGDFVRVSLPGISITDALDIPESAYTQEGYIWYLDQEDRLQRTTPDLLFRSQDRVIIKTEEKTAKWRVATTPLVSFLPGQIVRAQEREY